MFKKHCKIGFQHIFNAENTQGPFLRVSFLVQVRFLHTSAGTPDSYSVFDKQGFVKKQLGRPNLDQIITPQHIYIYMLWSYYLGHVWGFFMVTNWATFVFCLTLFGKNTIKIGVSAIFEKKGTRNF